VVCLSLLETCIYLNIRQQQQIDVYVTQEFKSLKNEYTVLNTKYAVQYLHLLRCLLSACIL